MAKRFITCGCFVGLLLALIAFGMPVKALDFPEPSGYVNDFAGVFSSSFKSSLEQELTQFEKETGNEIAVVTVKNLEGTTIEDYAVRLFEKWKIGKKDKDNGLLLLIALDERKVRIEVGYGLEPVVNDSRAGRIIREKITPEFKKGNYEEGVKRGVEGLKNYIVSGSASTGGEISSRVIETFVSVVSSVPKIIFGLLILVYLASFWGRSKRIWPGGAVGGVLGAVVGWTARLIWGALIIGFFFALFGFLLDLILSRNYKKRKAVGRPTDWWRSGGGFFSGGSFGLGGGGGSGGFGGGSSGGGGASGNW